MKARQHVTSFGGTAVRPFPAQPAGTPPPAPGGPGPQAWRLESDWDGVPFEEVFAAFLDSVDTTVVHALVLGTFGEAMVDYDHPGVAALVAAKDRFPRLRHVFVGDILSEEFEISWLRPGPVDELPRAYPELETLVVRGSDVVFPSLRHDALKRLHFQSGGLPSEVVAGVSASRLPALEDLELWLGVEDRGGEATPDDYAGILAGTELPALRRLGLMNSDQQDEVAAAVATAPVVARLEVLDLSMGTLGDEGAEALIIGQPLTGLQELVIEHHFVSDEVAARLRAPLEAAGVRVRMPAAVKPDEYSDRDGTLISERYTEVGE